MWAIDSVEQLEQFEADSVLYGIYIDNVFDVAKTNAIAEMKRGFDAVAKQHFHLLFPNKGHGMTVEFVPSAIDYNLDVAHELCARFKIRQESLPLILFPSVRDSASLLTLPLQEIDSGQATQEILRIAEVAAKNPSAHDMTPGEYRANLVKLIRAAQAEETFDDGMKFLSALAFVHYAPEALEALLKFVLAG